MKTFLHVIGNEMVQGAFIAIGVYCLMVRIDININNKK